MKQEANITVDRFDEVFALLQCEISSKLILHLLIMRIIISFRYLQLNKERKHIHTCMQANCTHLYSQA